MPKFNKPNLLKLMGQVFTSDALMRMCRNAAPTARRKSATEKQIAALTTLAQQPFKAERAAAKSAAKEQRKLEKAAVKLQKLAAQKLEKSKRRSKDRPEQIMN